MKKSIIVLSLALSFNALSGEKMSQANIKQSISNQGQVAGIQKLPIDNLILVKTDAGKTYFVTANGRFVFQGKLIDTWFRRTVDTLDEARKAHRVPLKHMGVKDDSLAVLKLGNPDIPRQATIFVDPYCSFCKILLTQINQTPEKYHVDLVLAPILGKNSKQQSNKLWCAKDKQAALLDLIHRTNLVTEIDPDCDVTKVGKSLTVMQLLGAHGTPFLVREDGLKFAGLPDDFDKWLGLE